MMQLVSTYTSTEIFVGAILVLALATLTSRWLYQMSLLFEKVPAPIWVGEFVAAWAMIISAGTALGAGFFVIAS